MHAAIPATELCAFTPPAFTDDLPTPHRRPPQPLGEHHPGLLCILRSSNWPGTHSRCLCTRSPANPTAQRRPSPWQDPTRPQSTVMLPQVNHTCRARAPGLDPRPKRAQESRIWASPASRRREIARRRCCAAASHAKPALATRSTTNGLD